ncbi:hypothetical protein GCM10011487_47660 [Steroidobacter agaridevorans]|uniref:DUF4401 domain-containing protein n=1 Tax=Steroidobacter agaridevorans TaxID=2695856 RepID=A0A829YJS8_9GAMM|nr:DUF4401 domain-containing protein [Steroidobacter agaridevorans]GFE82766.1 hypothetical protein GCM10011487_47660 [Steroidobacter agaridevorans]
MNGTITAAELRHELVRRQLIEPSADKVPDTTDGRPWFISLVLGASGWLAGVCVLAFASTLFEPESPVAVAVMGLVLLAAAFALYAVDRDSQFFDQFALALSIAGQFAMVWAAHGATDSDATTAAATCAMQVLLLFAMPNPFAKTIAAFFACCAWALTVRFAWWGSSTHDVAAQVALAPALIGWFIVWLPIIGATHALINNESRWMPGAARRIARPALTGLLISLSLATWISEPFDSLMFWNDQPQKNWLALWPLLGAAGALLAAIYAFRLRSRALIGIASVGALLHVGQFYYLLGLTLLTKSCIMVALGVLALLTATWLQRRGSEQEVAT